MGITNFHKWLRDNFPTCFLQADATNVYSCIYVDTNHILHHCIYRSYNEFTFKQELYKALDNLLSNYIATKRLVFAVDGPSPYSKVLLQRKRRLQSIDSLNVKKLNPLMLTPGTVFMRKVDLFLKEYVKDLINRYRVVNPKIEVVSSDKPDEGEIKIFKRIKEGSEPEDTHLVVGNDADLIVLACAVKPVININLLIQYQDSKQLVSLPKLLSENAYRTLKHLVGEEEAIVQSNIKSIQNQNFRLDFAIISIMNGNDYLPKLAYTKPDRLWDCYFKVYSKTGENLVTDTGFNQKFLAQFLSFLAVLIPKQFQKFHLDKYSDRDAKNYLEGLLWCLNMYKTGRCSMYDYTYCGTTAPTPTNLLMYINTTSNQILVPKSKIPPLSTDYYTLLLMPKKAKNLIPKKYHSLVEGRFSYIFEKEVCPKCYKFRTTLSENHKEYNQLKDKLDNMINKEKVDHQKEAINCVKEKINKVSGLYQKHQILKHKKDFSVSDVRKIVKTVHK